ncbi:hypothetical protein ASF49_15560 [Methylobacterium sp. Leaf104]|jgi:hypothetical protein|nr:hypothetical protein ASF08_12720 [Methylobacterium sp. Leaf85]KQP29575.1 hypothetical protein ASF49_15560 [Methylobacterium sp. Leaf104]KQQ24226.1 hypothetical protein ASF58_16735 [Methylobacterium sp. Leaf125]
MRNLQREVHDLCYLALRKDLTRPERRARLQEIDSRMSDRLPLDGRGIDATIERLEADRA